MTTFTLLVKLQIYSVLCPLMTILITVITMLQKRSKVRIIIKCKQTKKTHVKKIYKKQRHPRIVCRVHFMRLIKIRTLFRVLY